MTTKLFTAVRVGPYALAHRIVLAPLTRMRTDAGDVPGDLMIDYYTQRASRGGLLITEATAIDPLGIAYAGAPGIYTNAQVDGWRRVTDAVHAKGSRIFMQLWHAGRQAHPANTGGRQPVAPSPIRALEHAAIHSSDGGIIEVEQVVPRALDRSEIADLVAQFRQAAVRARDAGFDGVELHAANGYIIDQFLLDGSNQRQDDYGGTLENRARFLFEVVDAVVSVWGADKVAIRLSPSGSYGTMSDSDPRATFTYVATRLNGYRLAYLHVVEPRIRGNDDVVPANTAVTTRDMRSVFGGIIVTAGGFTRGNAEAALASGEADLVAFGRMFISNPDLPARLYHGRPLQAYDRNTFYGGDARGYTDYPPYTSEHAA